MIGLKRLIGYGIGIEDSEQDALERLNGFVMNNGLRIVNTTINRGRNKGTYWCEIDLLYDDGYDDREEE